MRKVITTFIKYPFYAKLVVVFLIIAGGISYMSLKKSFFPEPKTENIFVTVSYPGASPKEMEEGITTRIEEAIRGIVGIKEVNSTSSENFSQVQVTITGEYNIDDTLMEVKNAVDGISSFPVDAERPIVYKQRANTRAMFLGLSGDVDLLTLKKYANRIENDLLASGVLSQVSIRGLPPIELSVEVTEQNLLRYNLTFDDISQAIARNNRDISAGMIKSEKEEILIRSRARSVNPNVVGDIIIRALPDGRQLRIRDVGIVKTKFSDVSNKSLLNGKQAVYFNIEKLAEEDLEEISRYVHKYVEDFNHTHQGVKLQVTFDFLPGLYSRLDLMYRNGGIGLLLVVVALGMFLSLRLSLWVAWGIPASFLAMFIVASAVDVTVNMISLFGMILVIGILVDDGIVIAENIFTHFEKGKSPKRAAIDGSMEVLPAVFTSVTTTIVAFAPLLFLEGRMHMMFEMAFVVIFSLLFSLVEAFFVLPAHIGNPHVLRSGARVSLIRSVLDKFLAFMRYKIYGRLLKKIIRWRWVVVTVPVALLFITIGLFSGGLIKATFFPPIQFDFFNVNLAFKPGEGQQKTMDYLKRFENYIWEVNGELKKEFADKDDFIRFTINNLGSAFDGQESGSHAGNIFVILKDMEGAPISSFDILDRIHKKIGSVPEAEKFSVGARGRFGKEVSISLLGDDLDELDRAKELLMKSMSRIGQIHDITDTNPAGMREVRLKLKPKAYFLGLDHAIISAQVRQGFYGGQAQRLQSGRDELRVWVRYPKKGRRAIGQLDSMKIKTSKGEYPLSELAEYQVLRGPVNIRRYNSHKEVRVEADLVDRLAPVPPILNQIEKEVMPELKANFPGVRVLFQGQRKESQETMQNILRTFGIALGIIVIILLVHFKSVAQTLMVMMMIPLGWIGSAWGHGIEGTIVSILSFFGMVALSGVIINDAVVFISKYNSNIADGMPIEEAVYDAGTARFRAILLTSLTTVVGLYPIVLEGSFQAQFLKPMAIALAFGVLFGTFFILLFLPTLILTANDTKVWFKWVLSGKRPVKEMVEPAMVHQQVTID